MVEAPHGTTLIVTTLEPTNERVRDTFWRLKENSNIGLYCLLTSHYGSPRFMTRQKLPSPPTELPQFLDLSVPETYPFPNTSHHHIMSLPLERHTYPISSQ
ncbi:hypothetical protein K3495_g5023 [Podosphaera aphanis]|nr:hypothetical protein K3495_g5023 [Podosphaera aphanis]